MSAVANRNEERRRRLMLGELPAGFLRADADSTNTDQQAQSIEADHQAALALQHHLAKNLATAAAVQGAGGVPRLSITVVQAKLVKNYGLTRMDPYVRLRVGHCIYETHTDPSASKTPRWNKVIHCLLPPGVNSIYLEIFDECSFTMDELIAWAHIPIPAQVLRGETNEEWYPLTGKQGEGAEGMINLVMSYSVGPAPGMMGYGGMGGVMVVPSTGLGYAAMPVYPAAPPAHAPPPAQQAPPITITPEMIQQLEEMFPSIEREVIKSVLEANAGDKDRAVNSLLQMSE